MYNEEAKRKYLDELGKEYSQGYISTFRVAFNKIEPYEDFFKKDVSCLLYTSDAADEL